MKNMLSISALTIAVSLTLVGCQTTNTTAINSLQNNTEKTQAEKAKQELEFLFTKQLRSAFSYDTDITVSDAKRLDALKNATPEQLNNVKDKETYCEQTHDKAYVALLKKAEESAQSIDDAEFATTREAIKQTYLECTDEKNDWEDEYYYGDKEEEYLPNYDNKHTQADLDKTEMYHHYLIKPFSAKIQGKYSPLQGKFSLYPSVAFKQRHLAFKNQVPIHVDATKGEMYIWAESIAFLVSEYVDDELGAAWKDKWLKIDLNDGSLPDDIEKTLLTSALDAQIYAYSEEPATGFGFVTVKDLNKELPFLDTKHINTMNSADTVIKRQHTVLVDDKQSYLWKRYFYKDLTKKQPTVITNDIAQIYENDATKKLMTSRKLLNIFLNILRKDIDSYENRSSLAQTTAPRLIKTGNKSQYYGIKDNKISWWHVRYEIADTQRSEDEFMHVDLLTNYTYDGISNGVVNSNIAAPNNTNTVNFLEYTNSLFERVEPNKATVIMSLLEDTNTSEYDSNEVENVEESEEIIESELNGAEDESYQLPKTSNDDGTDNYESVQCVLMSVSIESMCDDDNLDQFPGTSKSHKLNHCESEQKEVQQIYDEYCQ